MLPSAAHHPRSLSLRSVLTSLKQTFDSHVISIPSYIAFPILSAAFIYLLWVLMYENGSADAMRAAVSQTEMPDGTPLKVKYTGIRPIDEFLSILVVFTYPVTNGEDKPSWLLMMGIVSTLQTATLWCYIDTLRKGRMSAWLGV